MNKLVSIVIPMKNASLYIDECIISIVNQSYQNWEAVIVNDHSDDGSELLVEEWTKKDARITLLENNGSGIIDALNCAYYKSSGHFITRMDADDIMMPNKIELLVQQLSQVGEGFVSTGLVEYFSEGNLGEGYINYANWLNKLTSTNSNFEDIYKECVIPSPSWMMYKSDFDSIGAFNSTQYPEDYDLCFRMYTNGIKVSNVKEVIHQWRDYSSRSSRTDENYADQNFINLKLNYFLKLESPQNIVLSGAGNKGKQIAKELIKRNISFRWITNNPKKKNINIYGIITEDEKVALNEQNLQIIVALSSPNDILQLKSISKSNVNSFYFFY